MIMTCSSDQTHRLRFNAARAGSWIAAVTRDPGEGRGSGGPLKAILDRPRLATERSRRCAGTGLLSQLLIGLIIVIVIVVLLLGQEDPEVGMAP